MPNGNRETRFGFLKCGIRQEFEAGVGECVCVGMMRTKELMNCFVCIQYTMSLVGDVK